METKELIQVHHDELIAASNASESSKVMELSNLVPQEETEVEAKLERLEAAENELDEITASYEEKLQELTE